VIQYFCIGYNGQAILIGGIVTYIGEYSIDILQGNGTLFVGFI
jgi:hypothetical protein